MSYTLKREAIVRIARQAASGPQRPTYCRNPDTFEPHEWVVEAIDRAYRLGLEDGNAISITVSERGVSIRRPEIPGDIIEDEDGQKYVVTGTAPDGLPIAHAIGGHDVAR